MQLDYELIDTGNGERLERYGSVLLRRPDPQIIWDKHAPELWDDVHAVFEEGWSIKKPLPEPWTLSYGEAKFKAQLTSFKHTGVFPEQEENWKWMIENVKGKSQNGRVQKQLA